MLLNVYLANQSQKLYSLAAHANLAVGFNIFWIDTHYALEHQRYMQGHKYTEIIY